eukprot:evm.model.scf_65.2 EVM.evm.TU.scf_65.2   scf_65:8804-13901(+)
MSGPPGCCESSRKALAQHILGMRHDAMQEGGGGGGLEAAVAGHSVFQRRVKDEDVVCVREGAVCGAGGPPWCLYCVCDGHKGPAAAAHVRAHLWSRLEPLLPRAALPDSDSEDFHQFALRVRTAVARVFVAIDEQINADKSVSLSDTCLIHNYKCNIGTGDGLPEGYLKALVPRSGARIILGSDGLWDLTGWEEAAQLIRQTPVAEAAEAIVTESIMRSSQQWRDDATAIVVDVLPAGCADWPKAVEGKLDRGAGGGEGRRKGRQGGIAKCLFGSKAPPDPSDQLSIDDDHLQMVANLDGLSLLRGSIQDSYSRFLGLARSLVHQDPEAGATTPREWAPAFLSAQRTSISSRSSADRRRSSCALYLPRYSAENAAAWYGPSRIDSPGRLDPGLSPREGNAPRRVSAIGQSPHRSLSGDGRSGGWPRGSGEMGGLDGFWALQRRVSQEQGMGEDPWGRGSGEVVPMTSARRRHAVNNPQPEEEPAGASSGAGGRRVSFSTASTHERGGGG